ncbi:hypothetical protein F2Q69_00005535 [Brassica cretica]|uniref:Uncharacterized protein n=1 Tax=Brassica cretica TaxID=69181 RepID=A0A8S9P1N3_BRACR|nr:hypothetical protein F2Q69_00005535 [Brassica cretica]
MRLRVWKVKKSCVSLTTMSGYQPRNNQQGSYQPQENHPPGFNNKGHHSSQQQANPSTSTPQESSTDALLKQILESQTRSEKHVGYELKNLHSKIDGSYNDLNNKFKALENQFAAMNTHQNRQQGSLPGKSEQNPKETMKAITLRSGKELPHRALTKDAEKQETPPVVHEVEGLEGQEEMCLINNNGSWYKKEPNFQYNNYQHKSYSNNQQSGYQPRNNQQGSYQLQQNPPPGFNNKGHHFSQQQANPFTSTPQDSITDALLKQILESQTRSEKHVGYELKNLQSKIDGSYNDVNNNLRILSTVAITSIGHSVITGQHHFYQKQSSVANFLFLSLIVEPIFT